MSTTTYRIRWKGRTEGPFSRDEILLRLTQGELSVLHRVEIGGEWRPLSDLITVESAVRVAPPGESPALAADVRRVPRPVAEPAVFAGAPASPFRVRFGYFLAGVTFLLPLVATFPALAFSGWIRRHGHRNAGTAQMVFIGVYTVLGLGFWTLIRQAYVNGHLG